MALLATRTWGEGGGRPLALLVHGITSSSRSWWRFGPALGGGGSAGLGGGGVARGGHGGSPPAGHGLGPADLAPDVVETVAAHLGGGSRDGDAATPVDLLVGHSLGALVSLALLAERPRFARRLLLEGPPGARG